MSQDFPGTEDPEPDPSPRVWVSAASGDRSGPVWSRDFLYVYMMLIQ